MSKQTKPSAHQESVHATSLFLTDAQLKAELDKCEYCQKKPCLEACPCHCSPTDFIRSAQVGQPSDIRRAAAQIMSQNPLGGICGQVCPDFHCMSACVHSELDGPVLIPEVQATIVHKAKELGVMPQFGDVEHNGKKVAVIGGGPAGLAAAVRLGRLGYAVTLRERDDELGGMCLAIPEFRLDRQVLHSDIGWMLDQADIDVKLNAPATSADQLLTEGYDAVVVATGLWTPIQLGIPGEELTTDAVQLLKTPKDFDFSGESVVVVGGGATAFDCAMTARLRGATRVEMIALENLAEMPLTHKEMDALVKSGVDVAGRGRLVAITGADGKVTGISLEKVTLKQGAAGFALDAIEPVPGSRTERADVDRVVVAIGLRPDFPASDHPSVVMAGDCTEGPTTVVEASAAGKNAAETVDALLSGRDRPEFPPLPSGKVKSRLSLPGYNFFPVSLETDFFGRPILSPFLLSAAPPTDGLEQMKKAYNAGWAGGIMKTAFDNVPIHIPGEYMFAFDGSTYANCDNVSGHNLDRVCGEIDQLIKLFPDRLTMASTGGPVSGDDEADRAGWVANTKKLESSGVMGIEYSLSCPQGGDGTEGDIVSQSAALTAKIVEWIVAAGDGDVPKLFKLTGAVTSAASIVAAVKEVLDRYPDKKAGITLANSFPTLAFRPGAKQSWEEGVVVGASGAGILNISYLSLANVAHLGVAVSGNGGPMDYKAAADFLALGCRTVQFCTLVTKYGVDVYWDLASGVSHLMAERGIASMDELIGRALPDPVTDFMDLPDKKKVSEPQGDLCLHCANCTRCPYLAISPGPNGYPVTDPSRCVGCGICALKCFAKAIIMRDRTPEEAAALKEN